MIELWKGGVKVTQTTTAGDGTYSFSDLEAGEYTVKEIVPAGTEATSPDSVVVPLAEGQDVTCIDFFNREVPTVCDDGIIEATVRVDEDCDGEFTWDDPLLDGVTFRLYHIEDDDSLTPVTPPSLISGPGWGYNILLFFIKIPVYYPGGHVIWEGLPRAYGGSLTEARYRLVMETPEGYTAITPESYDLTLHNCPWPCYWFSMNFLLSRDSHLCGHKYDDVDHNGAYDAGTDLPLEDWTIELYQDGSLLATTTTNAAGEYCFEDLPEGVYTVKEVLQEGWEYSYPLDGTFADISVGCGDVDGVDFLNARCCGSVEGLKFDDLDGDGKRDAGEPAIEGLEVTLEGLGDVDFFAVTTTGEDGTFLFEDLEPGSYLIWEKIPPGYYATRPARVEVTVGSREKVEVIFANSLYGKIIVNKWMDDGDKVLEKDKDTPKAGMPIKLTGQTLNGDKVSIEAETGMNGSYAFLLLEAGEYKVTEFYDPSKMQAVTPDNVDVTLTPGGEETVDFLNMEVQVSPEEIENEERRLPVTGTDQRPALIAAAMLILVGMAVLGLGLHRRHQE